MNFFCALFSCFFFVVLTTNASGCPVEAPSGCTCSKILEYWKVKCEDTDKITEIPSWLPNDTRYLEFDNCDIQTLNGSSFKNLVNLTSFKIMNQKNRLTFNDGSVFQGLNRLFGIGIDGNDIISLPAGLFANLPRLKTVFLDSNPLTTLPEDLFENSTNLEILRISETRLDKDTFAKIGKGHFGTNIKSLLISGAPIEHLKDGLFSGLPKLTSLAAGNCEIKSIGADILKGTMVSNLALSDNPIEFINENAFRDSALTQFECRNCQLTSNVTFNGFLKKISALRILNLQDNAIISVPKDAFTNIKALYIINLSNNSIATIEENPYANLPQCDEALATCMLLHDNPLNCDCNLVWLRSFAEKIEGNLNSWKCAKPKNVAGKSLMSLQPNEICNQTTVTTPVTTTATTTVTTPVTTTEMASTPTSSSRTLSIGTFYFLCLMSVIFAVVSEL